MRDNIIKNAAHGMVPVSQEGAFSANRTAVSANDAEVPSSLADGVDISGYSGCVMVIAVTGGGSADVTPMVGYAGIGFCSLPVACPKITVASGVTAAIFVDGPGAVSAYGYVSNLTTPGATTVTISIMPLNW